MRALFIGVVAAMAAPLSSEASPLSLWHSYRGREEAALLEALEEIEVTHGIRVEALAIPHEALASKLTTAIPRGHGPDLFIFAHERVSGWVQAGLLEDLRPFVDDASERALIPKTVAPFRIGEGLYGLPLAFKSLVLFYNSELVPVPPATTDDMIRAAEAAKEHGLIGIAYESMSFYFHAPWFHAEGAELLQGRGSGLASDASVRSLEFVKDLHARGLLPDEPSGALVTGLFNQGKAAMVISGPWLMGELAADLPWAVAPLPISSATGVPARPFMTSEGVFVAKGARIVPAARVAKALVDEPSSIIRARVGRQAVTHLAAWESAGLFQDSVLSVFLRQVVTATPIPTDPRMRAVWEAGDLALRRVLRDGESPSAAVEGAERRFRAVTRPPPERKSPTGYIAGTTIALIGMLILLSWPRTRARARPESQGSLREGLVWTSPALIAVLLLVCVPFAIGVSMSLFSYESGTFRFVGFGNFLSILSFEVFRPSEPLSFYFAAAVTVLWTVVNVALHVVIGVFLAVVLHARGLRIRAVYRVMLILPWAIPSYITALVFKGLFHKQFGAINGLLVELGLSPVAWFSSFSTAFFANVVANTWLGFPFMMLVSLGALQAIPGELYEAAALDGARAWHRFRHVTLPLIIPTLVPATLLGVVFTFNQFNIVYLVSGGEPDSATDILISEAYRWAFSRHEQYGIAAAYAVLIFALLLVWTGVSARVHRRIEGARS